MLVYTGFEYNLLAFEFPRGAYLGRREGKG